MIQNIETIFKDYTLRLNEKFNDQDDVVAINNMINFFNWCFFHKNNFMIPNFNVKYLKNVCNTYNQIKSNVLFIGNCAVFEKVNLSELKRIKFILSNYIKNFESIKNDKSNIILCELISEESIKNAIRIINGILNTETTKLMKNF